MGKTFESKRAAREANTSQAVRRASTLRATCGASASRKVHPSRVACTAVAAALAIGCFGMAGCSGLGIGQDAGQGDDANSGSSTLIADVANMDLEYTSRDKDATYDEAAATRISLDGTTASIEGEGAQADGSTVTVSAEGIYIFSGSLSDGQIVVDATNTEKVQLVFDGISVHNSDGPAVYIKQADKCFITLAEGSMNTLTDGADYVLEDDSDEPYATLFSKDDLTINGTGALSVNAAYRHAICSKDDLVITGGTFTVNSAEDALRGRDCVKIAAGTFAIESGEDAIKSNNDEDPTRGFVSIDGGTFAISAGDDAMHGEFAVFVEDGQIDISTCYEGLEAQQVYVNGGDVSIVSSDDSINASSPGESTSSGDAPDGPAGDFAGGDMPDGLADGELPERGFKGEDGMGRGAADNGDGTMPGMDGSIPEGASDDVTGKMGGPTEHRDSGEGDRGPQKSDAGGMRGMLDEAEEGCLIEINGGQINLVTEGDGIDSNGDFTMNGGTLFVSGPTNSGNGSLDVAGNAIMNGGTVFAAGPTGMAQSFSGGSQAFLSARISGQSGETITITGPSEEETMSFAPKTQYSFIVVSAPQMQSGETYTITAGQNSVEAQASTELNPKSVV